MRLWSDPAGPNRRHAPSSARRRDERVGRGLGWASLLVALVVGATAAWLSGSWPSRHPIGRPHATAGLRCDACHQDEATPHTRCAGCHGPHPSTRPGHAAALAQGALRCTDCHRIHEDFGGVIFSAGTAVRFGPGHGAPIEGLRVRDDLSAVVPVVPTAACARCHDPADSTDPIVRCLDATRSLTLCFDEHRAVRGDTLGEPGAQDRLALWTLTREAVARSPSPPATPGPDIGLLWGVVATGGFVGLVLRSLWTRGRGATKSVTPDVRPPERLRLPQIDASTCLGCSACVDACPYDVLALEDFVAKVARPSDCCGLTTCEERCPNGSLVVHDGAPFDDRPGTLASLESADVPGLYLAGDLTGMPLIRNAINQGSVAVKSAVAAGRAPEANALDLVIVGAGPAGLSAALQAKKEGLRYVVVEQGGLAQSIQSFPRGKLVFDQPLSVPLIGDLWLAESTKEDLLRHWTRIVRSEALPIHTGHRVSAIVRDPGGFWVACVRPDGETVRFRAAQVVLAIGRRGTPRTLCAPIDPSMESRVFYSLADAGSFAQRRCVVVGLGDVAMEAALALSYAPGTTVTIVARGDDFHRGKARNIAAIRAAEAAGRLQIRWRSRVSTVEDGAVVVEGSEGLETVPVDAVFVLIGAIAPWDFLTAIGVRRTGGGKKSATADPGHPSRVEPAHAGAPPGGPKGIP